jgi:hypothetical protein
MEQITTELGDGAKVVRVFYPGDKKTSMGHMCVETYYRDGRLHDPNPGRQALTFWLPDGKIDSTHHYINGKEIK